MKEKWQNQYDEGKPPWNYDELDPDFGNFFGEGIKVLDHTKGSKVIDLGCGTGSLLHHIGKRGFDITGTDIVNVLEYDIKNFIIDDALDSKLNQKYDIVLDRGLIHNLFHLKNRHKYFEMIGNITHDRSYIVLKVLSPYETRFHPLTHTGPYRFNEDQLINFFSMFDFKCIELKDTFFYSNMKPHLRGYFSIYKKEET